MQIDFSFVPSRATQKQTKFPVDTEGGNALIQAGQTLTTVERSIVATAKANAPKRSNDTALRLKQEADTAIFREFNAIDNQDLGVMEAFEAKQRVQLAIQGESYDAAKKFGVIDSYNTIATKSFANTHKALISEFQQKIVGERLTQLSFATDKFKDVFISEVVESSTMQQQGTNLLVFDMDEDAQRRMEAEAESFIPFISNAIEVAPPADVARMVAKVNDGLLDGISKSLAAQFPTGNVTKLMLESDVLVPKITTSNGKVLVDFVEMTKEERADVIQRTQGAVTSIQAQLDRVENQEKALLKSNFDMLNSNVDVLVGANPHEVDFDGLRAMVDAQKGALSHKGYGELHKKIGEIQLVREKAQREGVTDADIRDDLLERIRGKEIISPEEINGIVQDGDLSAADVAMIDRLNSANITTGQTRFDKEYNLSLKFVQDFLENSAVSEGGKALLLRHMLPIRQAANAAKLALSEQQKLDPDIANSIVLRAAAAAAQSIATQELGVFGKEAPAEDTPLGILANLLTRGETANARAYLSTNPGISEGQKAASFLGISLLEAIRLRSLSKSKGVREVTTGVPEAAPVIDQSKPTTVIPSKRFEVGSVAQEVDRAVADLKQAQENIRKGQENLRLQRELAGQGK